MGVIKRLPRTLKKTSKSLMTQDSLTNFVHKIGMGTDNPMSYATYSLNNLMSRNRTLLEAGYRSSWLIGQAVDVVAEDMTKSGVTLLSKLSPDNIKKLQVAINDHDIWGCLCDTIKWSRLYGGALAIMLIDGADYSKPLRLETIGKNTFKGLLVVDRWMCEPSLEDLIEDINKDFGKPRYYKLHPIMQNAKLPKLKVHHSRVVRFDGIPLPYYQKLYENYWGLSVIERIYDRLISYDSATLGASQLMFRAYLRVIGVKGLREALAFGGKEENAILKMFEMIRQLQSNEAITLLDSEDSFQPHQYSFGGVADVLEELGQQVSGATGIPLIRLFGQSPRGFSTGDTDLRNYYDNINREQENKLRHPLSILLEVISRSSLGQELPSDFEFNFNPLWIMSDKEKAEIATSDSATVSNAYGSDLISKKMALKELSQLSRTTGRFTNITDEDIEKADKESERPPSSIEEVEGEDNPTSVELPANPISEKEKSTNQEVKSREASTKLREEEMGHDDKPPSSVIVFPGTKKLPAKLPINPDVKLKVRENLAENFQKMIEGVKEKFLLTKDTEIKETPKDFKITITSDSLNNKKKQVKYSFVVSALNESEARKMAKLLVRKSG